MNKPLPSTFYPQLSDDKLGKVAHWLLDELHATEDDLVRSTDNPYTRGCTAFMRQRMRILQEKASGRHGWLGTPNTGNDLVFTISDVPCRYSNDDPNNPKKEAVISANRYQESFLNFDNFDQPSRFCFVIDRGLEGVSDPHVEFLGFTAAGIVACRWISSNVRLLRLEGEQPLVQSVEISKPVVSPKRRDGDAADAIAGIA